MPVERFSPSWIRRFARDERGIITVQNLFLTMACCAIGATGLDVTSFYAARTQLQVAADTGAHAALYTRHHGKDVQEAKTAAVAVATFGVPDSYDDILTEDEIVFGTWNAADSSFTPLPKADEDTTMPSAAQVVTNRADDNPVGSFLFRIVGVNDMDVVTSAIYTTYYDPCLSEGFVAQERVAIQSNNTFLNGFCIHSNTEVQINNLNTFGPGTVVSFPDGRSYYESQPNWETVSKQNTGFDQALRDATRDLSELERLKANPTLPNGELSYMDEITTIGHAHAPWYLSSSDPIVDPTGGTLTGGTYTQADLTAGRWHPISCNPTSSSSGSRSSRVPLGGQDGGIILVGNGNGNGNGNGGGSTTTPTTTTPTTTTPTTTTNGGGGGKGGGSNALTLSGNLSRVVIVTDCEVSFAQGTVLEDVIVYTTNTSDNSITAPSGLTLGKNDGCAEKGGATLLTRGGMHAAAQMRMYGSQIRLLGDFEFASAGGGKPTTELTGQGVSVMAAGEIDGTTHLTISACGKGMNRDFEGVSFVLAR